MLPTVMWVLGKRMWPFWEATWSPREVMWLLRKPGLVLWEVMRELCEVV